MKVGIVILNYKNYNETLECLKELQNQKEVKFDIVVVDNGSNNESDEVLKDQINLHGSYKYIGLKENVGFSRGNNEGIKYLLSIGDDFIIVSNSDISYTDENTLKIFIDSYEPGMGVMTPTIKNLNGLSEMRTQYKKRFFLPRVYKHLHNMQKINNSSGNNNGKPVKSKYVELPDGITKEHYSLTGCYFALTPDYLKEYSFLYPGTFLYGEEIATIILTHKAGLDTALIKTPVIIHKRAASTDTTMKEGSIKKLKMMAKSAKSIQKIVFLPKFVIKKMYN